MFTSPSTLTFQYLNTLLASLPEASALSTLLICKKILNIVFTSEGYSIRLDLRIRVNPPEPRVYKPQVGVYCLGKQPKPTWNSLPGNDSQSPTALAHQLVNDWTMFTGYARQYAQNDTILHGLMRGFEGISTTIKECETCTRILLPLEDQRIDWDTAEFHAVN